MTDKYSGEKLRLEDLKADIQERKILLETLSTDHWLYDVQKKTLDDRIREYGNLENYLKSEGLI